MPETIPILRARRTRRLSRQHASASRRRNAFVSAGIVLSLLLAALILISALAYVGLTRDLPSIEILPGLLNPPDGLLLQPTRLYDRTGTRLLYTFAPDESPRRYIPLTEASPQHLPKVLADAVVAMADPQFWIHSGYSLNSLNNYDLHGTIAQRLAFDLLLYDEPPSLRRALRERLLAAQITRRFGRTQVLEWYLNSAHFGRYAYGVQAAAELYFGKAVDELTLAETAILAGILDAPALNPIDASQVALMRGREVLRLLERLKLVDQAEAERALAETPAIQPAPAAQAQPTPAFVNLALSQLDSRFARARIQRGGLKILTSLDYDLQRQASCVTEVYATRLAGLPEPGAVCEEARWLPALPPGISIADSSASALILDPLTGQVLAVVGETIQGKETPLLTAHDPGSALDTFVYLTGFTGGLGPASLVWDIPGQDQVKNPDRKYHGPLRLRMALVNDYRAAAETVKTQMGAENVARITSSFGISNDQPATLLELAGAFGAFSAQGMYFGQNLGQDFRPVAILQVEGLDHSMWLDWTTPQAKPVVSSALAYLMTDVLSDETARQPSLGTPNVLEIGRPAGVKLGASTDGLEAWTIGYTPARVVVTWTGTHMQGTALTPRLPAVLYSGLMQYASRDLPPDGWPVPAGVTTVNVCDPSGLLPSPDCPELVNEVFLSGNEPHEPDHLYRRLSINRETGLLATVFTPPQLVEQRTFMVVPTEALAWAQAAGIPIPPETYDAIQPPPLNPEVNIRVPASFAEVQGKVQISGTAAGTDFASYRLLAGNGLNPQEWIEIVKSDTAVSDGLLGEWDTQGLSGLYALQLIVTRTDQRVDTAVIQVTVGG
jgi:membrane peptidoglycan carboxypeptidase